MSFNFNTLDASTQGKFEILKKQIGDEVYKDLIESIVEFQWLNQNMNILVKEEKIKRLIEGSLIGDLMDIFDLNGIRVSVL